MWDDVIGEPEGIRSPECAWRLSGHCFRLSRSCCYVFLSVLISPLLALCFGFTFACLAFQVSRRPFSLFSDRSVLPTVLSLSTQYNHYTNIIAMLTIIFVSQPIGNVGRRFTIDFQWKNFFLSILFCIKISWKFRFFFFFFKHTFIQYLIYQYIDVRIMKTIIFLITKSVQGNRKFLCTIRFLICQLVGRDIGMCPECKG